ncbi:MAG TPA: OsmC family protein [Gammaproteobacteria bacterium]|nr:OsmC family protein [Gammaproteobacteria bacterium]
MHPFPHTYRVYARDEREDTVSVETASVSTLETAAPPEFDGPGGHWSPETLLVASVADCYAMSFRAVARASKLEWTRLGVEVEGVLDRVEGVNRFVRFTVKPVLTIDSEGDRKRAQLAVEKAERVCLVTNSLTAEVVLEPEITVAETA